MEMKGISQIKLETKEVSDTLVSLSLCLFLLSASTLADFPKMITKFSKEPHTPICCLDGVM